MFIHVFICHSVIIIYIIFQPEKKETAKQEVEGGQKENVKETDGVSSSLPSHNNHQHQAHGGPRAVTMDYGMMQRYIKNLVGND